MREEERHKLAGHHTAEEERHRRWAGERCRPAEGVGQEGHHTIGHRTAEEEVRRTVVEAHHIDLVVGRMAHRTVQEADQWVRRTVEAGRNLGLREEEELPTVAAGERRIVVVGVHRIAAVVGRT